MATGSDEICFLSKQKVKRTSEMNRKKLQNCLFFKKHFHQLFSRDWLPLCDPGILLGRFHISSYCQHFALFSFLSRCFPANNSCWNRWNPYAIVIDWAFWALARLMRACRQLSSTKSSWSWHVQFLLDFCSCTICCVRTTPALPLTMKPGHAAGGS